MAKSRKKRNEDYQRWAVIIIGGLFVLSMVSFAFNSGSGRSSTVEIPDSVIIDGNLTDAQRALIISRYGSVVDYSYPADCGMECFEVKTALEEVANKYYGLVFVVYSDVPDSYGITVSDYRGTEDVYDINVLEDSICDVISTAYSHPECNERRALAAVFVKNESVVDGFSDELNETESESE